MTESIIIKPEYMKYCCICGKPEVEIHHCVHGTANRALSDREGLITPLCPAHHNSRKMSVHQNKEMKVLMHQFAQASWERHYIARRMENGYGIDAQEIENEARETFRRIFGQSWI